MRLSELIARETPRGSRIGPDPEIRGLTTDSRQIRPGYLFGALPGLTVDGRAYIGDALANGAVAVLAPEGTFAPHDRPDIALIENATPKRLFARLAARFFDHQPRHCVGITGTNGKTSTAQFTRQIWEALGHRAASIGTLGVIAATFHRLGRLTTPEPEDLHRDLAILSADGIDHVAIEASSQGLHQHRLDGVQFSAAAFTNLTQDHLDYHATTEAYFQAKTYLFNDLLSLDGKAVLNADSDRYPALVEVCRRRGICPISVGRAGTDFQLLNVTPLPTGQALTIRNRGVEHTATVPLIGTFQAENLLCALGLVMASGDDPGAAIAALANVSAVRGRMELAATTPSGASIYVDYAHTPDALRMALGACRPHTAGRLIVVVGAGGDRDSHKRPLMGAACAELADMTVVTDDNPRSEDPAAIRRAVMLGCPDGIEIADRREAISHAVRALRQGDVLVVAGKGHEQGQIVKDTIHPFDDVAEARSAVAGAWP